MTSKASRGAPLATVAPRIVARSAARDTLVDTADLFRVQAEFLAARFRLHGTRARLTAELAWGGR